MNYVIIYVEFNNRILLIRKNKPDYLKGLLNFPGGKIEPGESPVEAAIRELKEEAGLVAAKATEMGVVQGSSVIIHCVKILVNSDKLNPHPEETEPINWYDFDGSYNDSTLMPNLRVVIPLIRAGYRNWRVMDWLSDWRDDFHTVEVMFPNSNFILKTTVKGIGSNG